MFGKSVSLSIFYCLCYEMDISTDMLEDQVLEERYPDLIEEISDWMKLGKIIGGRFLRKLKIRRIFMP